MLLADGEHITIAFLFRGGVKFGQVVMEPEDQRDKYLMVERLASVAAQSGADGVVVTSEAWQALALPPDDPRAELRPGQRKDRGEGPAHGRGVRSATRIDARIISGMEGLRQTWMTSTLVNAEKSAS